MIVKRWIVPLVLLVTLLGSVPVGAALGVWQTTGRRLPTIGAPTMEDIRGSSTLGEVATTFGIPLDELRALLGLPVDIAAETRLKDLEAYNKVSAVRGLVAAYLDIPFVAAAEDAPANVAPESGAGAATEGGGTSPSTHAGGSGQGGGGGGGGGR